MTLECKSFLIFFMTKWERRIQHMKHFCFVPGWDVGLQGTALVPWSELRAELAAFEWNAILLTRTADCGYSNLGICHAFSQKWTKRARHFKKNSWQYLFPLNSSLQANIRIFGVLVFISLNLTASYDLKTFLMMSVVILINVITWYNHICWWHTWPSGTMWLSELINSFQVTNACYYKNMHG